MEEAPYWADGTDAPMVGCGARVIRMTLGRCAMVVGALGRKMVIVRPLRGRLPIHIRVGIGTPPENERFIEVLKAVLQSE